MNPIADLEIITQQEARLQFAAFTPDAAFALGSRLRAELLARKAGGTVEIELNHQLLFACATAGATPGQADWIRRKRNTVRRFARSSYAVGRILERDGETLEGRHGLTLADFAAHGGGFPILLRETGMVGTMVLSGLPQREDHALVVATLAAHLGIAVPALP
jgi:uncharacterized protein (UPF0303 family)